MRQRLDSYRRTAYVRPYVVYSVDYRSVSASPVHASSQYTSVTLLPINQRQHKQPTAHQYSRLHFSQSNRNTRRLWLWLRFCRRPSKENNRNSRAYQRHGPIVRSSDSPRSLRGDSVHHCICSYASIPQDCWYVEIVLRRCYIWRALVCSCECWYSIHLSVPHHPDLCWSKTRGSLHYYHSLYLIFICLCW